MSQPSAPWWRATTGALSALLVSAAAVACTSTGASPARIVPNSDAGVGRALIVRYGCGSCHTIPGIKGANAFVGPPLIHWARRSFIAGVLPNTPDNLITWVEDPKSVEPRTDMPNLGVSEEEARNIAAYLYSIR